MRHENVGVLYGEERPILLVAPHIGTHIPDGLQALAAWTPIEGRLSDPAGVAWVATARQCGISIIAASIHPCVIDLNIAIDNRSLTPRLNRVGLCRTHTSRGEPLYPEGCEPGEDVVAGRIAECWQPFHDLVTAEIIRLRERHENIAVIVSHANSWLSPYREQAAGSDFNLGTCQGSACNRHLVSALTDVAEKHGRSWVVNGKLGGVFAAQRYGLPQSGVHAVEIETAGKWRGELDAYQDGKRTCDVAQADMEALLKAVEATVSRLPGPEQELLSAMAAARAID
ncbi:N-formylglutamate amidohydrolase [Paraburkholderia tropica]|uniref:N-formylglutamate amidohydrolase n=1 Tax=Paraburkholderia tropica TaxID=92647 RepID=UPI002AB23675|nr:N-formylglutamate amidohydrolase [Paraburkholderia tropica]